MGARVYWSVNASRIDENGDQWEVSDETWNTIRAAVPPQITSGIVDHDDSNVILSEIFSEDETRVYFDEAEPVLREFSKQFPDVLFRIKQDCSDEDMPGIFHYHFLNGKFRDVTPPYDPLPFDASLMQ